MADELDLTLTELEGQDWGQPTFRSHLVTECHRLRKKRLGEFAIEDLRIMIGQNIGLKYLVPIAIKHLQSQPLAEGDFYPGDLLCNVLRIEPIYWKGHPAHRDSVAEIADRAVRELEEHQDSGTLRNPIAEAISVFQANRKN